MPDGNKKAVVVGAGCAGLAAAFRLAGSGWRVTVLEERERVGGRCATVETSGYLFDTGAQHFRDSYDSVLKTAISLGLGETFRIPTVRAGVFKGGEVREFVPRARNPLKTIPWGAHGIRAAVDVPSVVLPFIRDYRRYNIRTPCWWKDRDLRTASEFLTGRTTRSYRKTLAEPLALDFDGAGPDELSAGAYMAALRCWFMDNVVSLSRGMGSLPEAMAGGLDVKTGIKAEEVSVKDGKASGVVARPTSGGRAGTYRADLVVSAVPSQAVTGIAGDLGGVARAVLEKTRYTPALVVNLGLKGVLNGPSGPVLLPGAEGFRASSISTNFSKGLEYAPAGCSVVTLVYSGGPAEALMGETDGVALETAVYEAERVLDLRETELETSRVDRHPKARPLVSPGHAERIRELWKAGSGLDNLVLAGDWTASPTVEGAMTSGYESAADRLEPPELQ